VQKYAWIFFCGQFLFQEANSLQERSLMKTVSFEEQVMFKDKTLWQSILFFKVKWRLLCLLTFKYVSQSAGSFENKGQSLALWIFPSFSWGIYSLT